MLSESFAVRTVGIPSRLVFLQALAVHCGYFDSAFNGAHSDANKDELHLHDVDADHFSEFLKVVYSGAVGYCNVAAVMPLAVRFRATEILEECERVLVSEQDPCEAIRILDKCGLDDLKKQLIPALSLQHLKRLTEGDELAKLSRETVVQLLKESVRRLDNQRT